MREIKFRAWADGRMHFQKGDTYWCINGDTGFIRLCLWEYAEGENVVVDNLDCEDFALMQYTGLRDKNGVEIYEGDVMDNGRVKFVVIWREEGYWSADVINDPKYIPESNLLYSYGYLYEVIGNIHENPELMEQNDE